MEIFRDQESIGSSKEIVFYKPIVIRKQMGVDGLYFLVIHIKALKIMIIKMANSQSVFVNLKVILT